MLLYFQHKKKGWVGSTGVEPYDGGMIYYMDKRNSYDIPASGLYEINVDTANIYYPNDACYCFIRSGLKMVDSIEYIEAVKLGYQGPIPISEVRYATGQYAYSMSNPSGGVETFLLQKTNDGVVKVEISLELFECSSECADIFDATVIFREAMNSQEPGVDEFDVIVPLITESYNYFAKGVYMVGNTVMVDYGSDYYTGDTKYYIWKNNEFFQVNCRNTIRIAMRQTPNRKNEIADYMEEHLIAANTDVDFTVSRKVCDEGLLEITTVLPGISCDIVCKMFNPKKFTKEVYEKHKDDVMTSCEAMLEKGRRLIKNGMAREYASCCSYRRFFAKKV